MSTIFYSGNMQDCCLYLSFTVVSFTHSMVHKHLIIQSFITVHNALFFIWGCDFDMTILITLVLGVEREEPLVERESSHGHRHLGRQRISLAFSWNIMFLGLINAIPSRVAYAS